MTLNLKFSITVGKIGADKSFIKIATNFNLFFFFFKKTLYKCNSMSFVCNILQKSRNSDSVIFKLIFLGTQLFEIC